MADEPGALNQVADAARQVAGAIAGVAIEAAAAAGGEAAKALLAAGLDALSEGVTTGFVPMASSMILGAEYRPDMEELSVTFVSGRVYQYFPVPMDVFVGLLDAPSKGRYMRAAVIGVYG